MICDLVLSILKFHNLRSKRLCEGSTCDNSYFAKEQPVVRSIFAKEQPVVRSIFAKDHCKITQKTVPIPNCESQSSFPPICSTSVLH